MAERYLIPEVPKLPEEVPVPPSVAKKAEVAEKKKQERCETRGRLILKKRQERSSLRLRSFGYEKEYFEAEKALREKRALAKQQGGYYREAEPKVLFVIRLKGINKLAPKPRKVLQLFRLRQINNGVFLKANKATLEMLKMVHPFVAFGTPSLKTIRQLLYKRGYAKVGRPGAWSRQRILSNETISERLGKYGIHGMEDLVREIYLCGPHFKEANNFLWPFKLSCPRGGWIAKRRSFCDPRGGDWGDREHFMSKLIQRMN